eukprot:TRINITY_DN11511_c0_g2_i13.p1 TRINITY_DN11511_c0_g2~~TRINITY_DN11511_c0_g2_i13.p1  ORF type:complete len:315 (+),score=99.59 TRINITY_DN11511_c0_g2_i13:88-1032(+)
MIRRPPRSTLSSSSAASDVYKRQVSTQSTGTERGTMLHLQGAGSCKVHPSVIFTILDHHSRRKEGQDRVIGTLLGTKTDGVVEIQNCFPVPHTEHEDQVAVDMEFHHNMYKLHQQVNKREEIIGWYATGTNISEHSAVIHEFYGREGAPVHLVVDPTLDPETKITARAFVSKPVTLGAQALGTRFQELCTEIVSSEAEQVGFDMLMTNMNNSPFETEAELQPTDLDGIDNQLTEMLQRLSVLESYVDEVQEGKKEADPAVGNLLADTIALVPNLNPGMYEKTFQNGLQDLLMVVYLSNLTRTQLALAERIQSVV